MTPRAVHQFVSSFVPRDAVSMHALRARDVLRGMGLESEIYVKETRGEMVPHARPYRSFEGGAGVVALYQSATGSAVADYLMERAEPLIVNYHNLTPPEFFAPWEPHTAVELSIGRRQMVELAGRASAAIAVSEFNRADLDSMGYERIEVAPLLLDPASLHHEPDPEAEARLRAGRDEGTVEALFVGRLAPNKAQHDLIRAVAAHRHIYGDGLRLTLVGAPSSPRYQRALRGFVGALGLDGVVRLTGEVSDGELAAHYSVADLFVCVSEHEGFCAPLLEAMHHDVPVVAYDAGAVAETMGGAGVLLADKHPLVVAAAIERIAADADLRGSLVAAGRRRLAELSLDAARRRFAEVVGSLLAELDPAAVAP